MTKAEFLKPYLLLVLQPWGRRYDLRTPEGQAQVEFYFSKLGWAHPKAWEKTVDLYAQGKEWPSVTELKRSLQHVNGQYVRAIGDDRKRRSEQMPEKVREMLEKIGNAQTMPQES